VIEFYIGAAQKTRAGRLRNGGQELAGVFLGEQGVEPLSAFLRALNEDYN
jgi:hypothetical protein